MEDHQVAFATGETAQSRAPSHRTRLAALFAASSLFIAACGGGNDNATPTPTPPPPPPPPATASVPIAVIDGALRNALVCLDQNGNGACDSGEPQGRTDAGGKVTLTVATADVGKYPVVAMVGTDAVDAVFGPVAAAYTMSAPADRTDVISPLTTLVQQMIARGGVTSAAAASAIQAAAGITSSPLADFTQTTATNGAASAADLARLWVLTVQAQSAAVAGAVGTQALDGKTITQADADNAARVKVAEMLPDMAALLADPAIVGASSAADKDVAMRTAAASLVSSSGLGIAGMAMAVAANTQIDSGAVPVLVPAAATSLDILIYSDAQNYTFRTLGGTLAQQTPDGNNLARYMERRVRASAGIIARWGAGSDPTRGSDVNWNGSAWVACPINYENVATGRDARGRTNYTYCAGRETGVSDRAHIDIAGRSMADVYAQIRDAKLTNLFIANPAALGSATFPTGSVLFVNTNRPVSSAITYVPVGQDSPAGTSSVPTQYSAQVAAGGVAANQAAGTGCNAPETNTNGQFVTNLEAFIASKPGAPCIYAQGSVTYNGATYQSDPQNEWWGQSTVSLSKVGTVPVTPTSTSTGFYTGNTLLRVAFAGQGANAVTYYACKERYLNGSARNCTAIGSGSYTITQLGDARVLTLNNPPAQTSVLTFNRVFVERGGFVYFGFQSKPAPDSKARLNGTASDALLAQLGITPENPDAPLALTPASYQGVWDLRDSVNPVAASVRVTIAATGITTCVENDTGVARTCSLTITDPATGAFTGSIANTNGAGAVTLVGRLDFLSAKASGTYQDTGTATNGTFVGGRR